MQLFHRYFCSPKLADIGVRADEACLSSMLLLLVNDGQVEAWPICKASIRVETPAAGRVVGREGGLCCPSAGFRDATRRP